MKLSRGTAKIIAAILICSVIIGVVVATVMQTRVVQQNITVEGSFDFQLFLADGVTEWTVEDWGSVERGQSYTSAARFIQNTGGDPIYLKWDCSEPSGISFTIEESVLGDWPENTYLDPLAAGKDYQIKVTLTVASSASAGDISADITFSGSDTGA